MSPAARRCSTVAIRLDPKFGMYYGNRAIAWTEKGDAPRALADFNRDVEIEPTVAAVVNNRGHFFLERHGNDQAIADFTEAIRLDPLNYAQRADTLRYRGDYQQSLAEYARALAIMPDYVPAFTGRGDQEAVPAGPRRRDGSRPRDARNRLSMAPCRSGRTSILSRANSPSPGLPAAGFVLASTGIGVGEEAVAVQQETRAGGSRGLPGHRVADGGSGVSRRVAGPKAGR
ncbi:MAG TPA: tetratricopeptide repeat protein [Bradyrhizobium sp.]